MKHFFSGVLLGLMLVAPAAQAKPKHTSKYTPMTGKVTRVINGDTVQFQFKDHTFRLQLYGIDAPEDGQPLAQEAQQALKQLALFQSVRVQILTQDMYKRYIARITLADQRDLSQEMVRRGWAWWYRQFARKDATLQELESAARSGKLGLWQLPAPVPPWEYREMSQRR
jgi:micrococcal nuclease